MSDTLTNKGLDQWVSFRDPDGFLLRSRDQIFRVVFPHAISTTMSFLSSKLASDLMMDRMLVPSRIIPREEWAPHLNQNAFPHGENISEDTLLIEHEKIFFPSYPYEWCSEMLYEAGLLTLQMALKLLKEDWILKDASPYNVLFDGTKPIFIDLLSFEKRTPGEATWKPYAQFIKGFILPLLVYKLHKIHTYECFCVNKDGLEIEAARKIGGVFTKFNPRFFKYVVLSSWLSKNKKIHKSGFNYSKTYSNDKKVVFILTHLFEGLLKSLKSLKPGKIATSAWSDYWEKIPSYSVQQLREKETIVKNCLESLKPGVVLDIGCNNGVFSAMAARIGAKVIAIDQDPCVLDEVWRNAKREGLDILPLVVNFARPSPANGWMNQENPAFLERVCGKMDLVMGLAVLHHLLVTERIPLDQVLSLLAKVTKKYVLLEYVDPQDKLFQQILRGRYHLFQDLNIEVFEKSVTRFFTIEKKWPIEGVKRCIFLLQKKI